MTTRIDCDVKVKKHGAEKTLRDRRVSEMAVCVFASLQNREHDGGS